MHNSTQPIVFYDGVCGLCDKSVQFILRYDKKEQIVFCALQSNLAKTYLATNYTDESIVLYYEGKLYYRSSAALRIAWILGGFWSLFALLLVVPTFIRDAVYKFIANNRYRWFGKFDACKLPTPQTRKRFLGV